ncbi:hypothetical protein NGR_c05740 [Sinorhizobium fredii NGR234]|uniref:Uncharacterized protein n=1 Tax=Sinorhizobium fredii (strain NBRC 101917 / NGR234) TaxID=394 RepID=C3MHN9_SINFN|nr:hypothetical protein NGR_c05740 [Sinorhizobium fredii NGR234]
MKPTVRGEDGHRCASCCRGGRDLRSYRTERSNSRSTSAKLSTSRISEAAKENCRRNDWELKPAGETKWQFKTPKQRFCQNFCQIFEREFLSAQ